MNKGYTIFTQKTRNGDQFRIQISDGFDAKGIRRRTTKLLPLGTTKTDAHKEARTLVKQKEEGTMAVANAKGTVAEYLREWHEKRARYWPQARGGHTTDTLRTTSSPTSGRRN